MIDCGIDESTRNGGQLLVVSAMIGQTANMRRLNIRWRNALERSGVDYFHAKEHWNGQSNAYHGITLTKRRLLLNKLIGLIHKYAEVGFSVAIDKREYQEITTPRFRSNWGAEYAFAIQMLMILIHQDLEKRGRLHEKVNMLIEDGKHVNQALEIMGKVVGKEDGFIRLASIGKGGKTDNCILQAGDLLAYGCSEYLASRHSEMYAKLCSVSRPRFGHLHCGKDVVSNIKRDIEANLARKRELRLTERLKTPI